MMGVWFVLLTQALVVLVTVILLLYAYYQYAFTYWKKRGVFSLPATIPFGNMSSFFLMQESLGANITKLYNEIRQSGEKFAGIYNFFRPVFFPVDPELVKHIMAKDFQYFTDRGVYHDENNDPLSSHLFSLDGAKWRTLRTKLTPTFTSGKMKLMFPLLAACGNELKDAVDKIAEQQKPLDAKDFMARFTIDIIGSCAFGLDCNSLKEKENEFRKHTSMILTTTTTSSKIRRLIARSFPPLMQFFKIKLFDKECNDFFVNIVKETVDYREKHNIKRDDFLNLLLQLKDSGKLKNENLKDSMQNGKHVNEEILSLNEVIGQCFLFFFAGYETASSALTFSLFELAMHQNIQEELRKEVLQVLSENGGVITYESLSKMTYMDKVIAEALRKYPSLTLLNRKCIKDYKIPNTNIVIERGTDVYVPSYGLQWDPEYYPNPEKFDPERFNEENKNRRNPYTYLPFGEGPRVCIGMRFGFMQTKVGLAVMLSNYRLSLNEKSTLPIEFKPAVLVTTVKGNIYLNVEKLTK